MHILLVHDQPLSACDSFNRPAGGIGVYLTDVSRLLAESGERVSMLRLFSGEQNYPSREQSGGYAIRSSSIMRRRDADQAVLSLIDQLAPDVIHLHSTYYGLGPWMIPPLSARAGLLLTQHDVTPFCPAGTLLRKGVSICDLRPGAHCVLRGCYRPGAHGNIARDIVRLAHMQTKLSALARLTVSSCQARSFVRLQSKMD